MLIFVPSNDVTIVVKASGSPVVLSALGVTVTGVFVDVPITGARITFTTGNWYSCSNTGNKSADPNIGIPVRAASNGVVSAASTEYVSLPDASAV